jgi:hypothetical protein
MSHAQITTPMPTEAHTSTAAVPVDVMTPPPQPRPKPNGLFGKWTDVITLGGLSLLAFPLFLLANSLTPLALPDGRVAAPIIMLLTLATYAVNYPHYAATYARAYGERATIREYWRSTILVPLVLFALAALALAVPTNGVAWYFKAYLLLSGYHYSGQTYGVALIFAGQTKLQLTKVEKRLLMVPIYGTWLYTIGLMESVTAPPTVFVQEMRIAPIGLPMWVGTFGQALLAISALAYVALNVKLVRRTGRALPGVSQVVLFAHFTWFVAAPHSDLYANFVPFFHCLQYLMVTTYFHLKGQRTQSLDDHAMPVWSIISSSSRWGS